MHILQNIFSKANQSLELMFLCNFKFNNTDVCLQFSVNSENISYLSYHLKIDNVVYNFFKHDNCFEIQQNEEVISKSEMTDLLQSFLDKFNSHKLNTISEILSNENFDITIFVDFIVNISKNIYMIFRLCSIYNNDNFIFNSDFVLRLDLNNEQIDTTFRDNIISYLSMNKSEINNYLKSLIDERKDVIFDMHN